MSELAAVGEALAASTPYMVMFAIGVVTGSLVPAYYAQERLRGFGRAMMGRLPYQPPPGLDREQAMRAAVEAADADDVKEE
ncbi:hypothetical protein [Halolamina salina]|uniref:Uncharacterized protein n=1 Tax=Halolamina salina TaxID=1220023 RepID=A0ABD6BBI9_9EURY